MFYTRPVLNFESQYREPDDSATVPLGEIMRSQTAADLAAGQIGSRSLNLTSVYDDHNAKVKGLMGVDLPNPAKQTFGYFADPAEKDRYRSDLSSYRDDGGSGSDSAFHASWVEKNYRRQLEELAAKRPDLRAELLPDESFESQSFARRRSVEDQAAAVWERSDKGPLAWAASIAGSAWAGVQDPTNWITAPFGFGGVGTGIKGIAMGFLKNGTANAAVEASIQPFIQAQRDEAGQTSGFDQAAMAVGGAFVLGGAIDATIRGTARTLRYGFGYEPVVKDGIVVAYRKPKADGTVTEIKAETISKADAGDAASIREVAEKSGLSNDPVVKTTLDAMDANEILAAKPSDRISDTDHATATTQALRHVADPDNEPLPVIFEGASPSKLSEIEADLTEARTFLAQASAAAGQMQGAAPEIVSRVQEAQARLTSRVSELEASRETMRQEIMSDELIEMVDGGTVPPDLANVVVSHVGDKSIQGRIAQDLLTRKPASPTEARYQIAELLQSPDYRAPVKDLGPEPAGLPTRALDDPYGPDALKQVAYYEAKYAEELGIAKKPVERAQSGRTGEAANVTAEPQPPAVPPAELISEAINEALALAERILPEGSRVEVTPDLMVTAGGATIDAVQIAGNIRLAAYAIDPAARIGHEGVHVLVTRGLISPAEVGLLANAARKSGAFSEASEAAYREAYAGRAEIDRLIDEEAAAHFVEGNVRAEPAVQGIVDRIKAFIERLRNALSGAGFQTADDVSQAILSGEAAGRVANEDWMRPGSEMYALREDQSAGQSMRRALDDLGYYSGALEAAKNLRQAKGTPEQMLVMLGKEGAKPGEISATGLDKFVEGKKSVTKDEIIKHLEDNKVKVNEASYGETPEIRAHAAKLDALREQMMAIQKETAARVGHHGGPELNNDPRYMALVEEFDKLRDTRPSYQNTKWSAYSLDPSNPTYRETVLHLPETRVAEIDARLTDLNAEINQLSGNMSRDIPKDNLPRFQELRAEAKALSDERANLKRGNFQSGHFSEPNIIGHMMTSMTKHEGKPVYTIDQIQSDWGQKLRDGGVRDEAKIRELKRQLADKEREFAAIAVAGDVRQRFNNASARIRDLTKEMRPNAGSEAFYKPMIAAEEATLADILRQHPRIQDVIDANNDILRVKAELATAKSTSPGHPLVNTTDQWTNTTLRRAIRQAAESDAEYIAIPSGKTVLSYNPGDEHGMGEFYNKIVPKNLKNLLTKIDRETPAPQRIETLDSPSGKTGLGKGFTLFKLTDKVKATVIEDGQAMFALRSDLDMSPEARKARAEAMGFDTSRVLYHGTSRDFESFVPGGEAARKHRSGFRPTNSRDADMGVWLSENPQVASEYADQSAKNVVNDTFGEFENSSPEVKNAIIEAAKREGLQNQYEFREAMERVKDYSDTSRFADEVRSLLDIKEADAKIYQTWARGRFFDYDFKGRVHNEREAERVAAQASSEGYDGVRFSNIIDTLSGDGEPSTSYLVFDPSNIRSVNAAFDPAKSDSSNIMFALRDSFGKFKVGSKERTENLQMDFANIEADFQRTMLQDPVGYAAKQEAERVKVQQKRAALLNAKANEIVLDDVNGYKDPRGRSDPAKAFMLLHESFGDGVGADLKNARDVIHNTALEMMAKPLWFMRKGAITGDKRRTGKLVGNTAVKTTMHNMVREAAGEDTGDAMAKTFAKAWLDTAEYLRQRFNAAGGDIGKLKSWIMPQYHDPAALIKMKMQNWTDYMMRDGVLDRDAMVNINTGKPFTDTDLRNALHYVWKQITSDGQYAKEVGQGGGGKGAMYKRHADHRFIHFKDADAWIKYQTEVGGGDLYAAMIGHISSMSRDIAAMERFGANPELVRQRVKEQIIKDAGQAQSAKSMFDELKEKLDTLTAQYNSTPTKFEAIMNQISAVHTELDAVRSKYAPQLGGKPSKRNKGKIDKLQEQLFDLHNQMRDAMGKNTLTPEHRALSSEISSLLDEMSGIDLYPVMSRDPLQRAQRILKRSDEIWKSYIGTSNVPADGLTADAMTVLRNWISASSLVFAPFSAVTDQSTQLGARLFVGMPATRQLISFVKGFTPADRQAALAAGLGLDQAANAFQEQARFLGRINTRQLSGYIADRSHAYSGLTPMTQASKIGFGLDYMRWMVGLKDTAFNDLPDAAAAMLKRHGMTKADWTALQTATPETVNGFPMLTRKAIAETAGDDIAEKYMTMLYRERSHAVIEGTMRGRTSIVSDAQPGSITGEGLRSIAMLKSFPITYGLMIIGRFYRTLLEGRTESAMAYGAAIFIVGTMLGALAKQLKNVGQGRDPEDMTNPNFWAAAFMQSGGAGIFGDFVASGVNRFGSGFATTLAGPVFDRVGTLRDLTVGNAMQYASDEKTNTGRELTKVIRQNTPGMFAPWYVRTLYERMIIDELQKQIDPEAHKSFRSKINGQKKRAGNDFFHPPGQPYAARGPNFGAAFGN